MDKLHISLVQADLKWEDIDANLAGFSEKIANIKEASDLIILPEMFTTGFSMNPAAFAESMDGKSMQWLADVAASKQSVVTGSLIIKEKDRYFNRLVWMRPDGTYVTYDKRHLFTLAGEHNFYQAGKDPLYVDIKGWKVQPLICYDLRFPVFSRNTLGYDLLIYVANWPVMRSDAWKALLTARAIENQSYTIGVNRVGTDGNDFYHSGDSSIIDYAGGMMTQLSHVEGIFTATLDKTKQQQFRKKLPFLADRDEFEIAK